LVNFQIGKFSDRKFRGAKKLEEREDGAVIKPPTPNTIYSKTIYIQLLELSQLNAKAL